MGEQSWCCVINCVPRLFLRVWSLTHWGIKAWSGLPEWPCYVDLTKFVPRLLFYLGWTRGASLLETLARWKNRNSPFWKGGEIARLWKIVATLPSHPFWCTILHVHWHSFFRDPSIKLIERNQRSTINTTTNTEENTISPQHTVAFHHSGCATLAGSLFNLIPTDL